MILISPITDNAQPVSYGEHPDKEQRVRQQGASKREEVLVEPSRASGSGLVCIVLYISCSIVATRGDVKVMLRLLWGRARRVNDW